MKVAVININNGQEMAITRSYSLGLDDEWPKKKNAYYPFLGTRVTCGSFGITDDFVEKYQSLDARFIKNKTSTFFFKAMGLSMSPLIMEGDILVVDRSIEAKQGKVVVVSHEGSLICKRYFSYAQGVILKSDNPRFKDILVTEEMEVLHWGVVTAIIREV